MEQILWYDTVSFTRADVRAAGIQIREVPRWVNGYKFMDLYLSPAKNCDLLTDFLKLFIADEDRE